jgi:anti-sigma factor ChrR (cupin superfamily)
MSVIRHMRGHPARAARLALWAGTVSGLVLIAVAGGDLRQLRTMDNLGALLFVGCPAVLIAWWARRHMPVRIARDDILIKQVEHNTAVSAEAHAAAAEAVALAKTCEKRVVAFGEIVARAAGAAEIPSPDTDETMPGLRIVGNLPA